MALDSSATLGTIINSLEESTLINIKPQMIEVINNLAVNNDAPIKKSVTDVLGVPSVSTDTWNTITSNIQGNKNALAAKLNVFNVSASNTDAMSNLIDKVDSITKDANAAASDIVSGKTAYINKSKITGNIPVNPGLIANSNHIASAQYVAGAYSPDGLQRLYMRPGIAGGKQVLDGDMWITAPEPNLIPANILSGKSIFGVAGTASSVGKNASGGLSLMATAERDASYNVLPTTLTVSGLSFKPNKILIRYSGGSSKCLMGFYDLSTGLNIMYEYHGGSSWSYGGSGSDSFFILASLVNGGFTLQWKEHAIPGVLLSGSWYAWE